MKKRDDALRKVSWVGELKDGLGYDGLAPGIRSQAQLMRFSSELDPKINWGASSVDTLTYVNALDTLAQTLETTSDSKEISRVVREQFDFYEPYGSESWGQVFLTSYFEPEIAGRLRPEGAYTQPLYRRPLDLVEFVAPSGDERFFDVGTMRGRLEKTNDPKRPFRVLPFFTRKEIDTASALKGRGLELAYVDPIDAFFLHIQGSGVVTLADGSRLPLSYADQNGQRYEPIGKHLLDRIPKEELDLPRIESYLRSITVDEARGYLNKNPSYVFYDRREGPAVTAFGTPVVAGRTIATDARFFPKGALAYLLFEEPVFDEPNSPIPTGWKKTARFVIDQDTGGAIKGGGRVDLFWGTGNEAKKNAGVIKQQARLFYLVPKLAAEISPTPSPTPSPTSSSSP